VTGENVMVELISELQASAAAAGGLFEGEDMAQVGWAGGLGGEGGGQVLGEGGGWRAAG
jgi:hypothetical protein